MENKGDEQRFQAVRRRGKALQVNAFGTAERKAGDRAEFLCKELGRSRTGCCREGGDLREGVAGQGSVASYPPISNRGRGAATQWPLPSSSECKRPGPKELPRSLGCSRYLTTFCRTPGRTLLPVRLRSARREAASGKNSRRDEKSARCLRRASASTPR